MRWLPFALLLCSQGCADSDGPAPADASLEVRVADTTPDTPSPADGASERALVDADAGVASGPIKLFNGTDLTGIKLQTVEASQITIDSGELRCAAGKTGYWYTDRSYANYTLRFEVRFVRPPNLVNDADFTGNSGYPIHIQTPHQIWPTCIEVQGMYRDIANIFPLGAPAVPVTLDNDARAAAQRPVGQWNTMTIVSDSGRLTSWLNGVKIASSDAYSITSGPIGFQCEGVEIHWRNIVLTPAP
ncbi:MAG: DUF1080 domain-containing protein [Myxococcales bacterium]|nr:DUF1080 domain-containing protein [Myxococcales bacterium]